MGSVRSAFFCNFNKISAIEMIYVLKVLTMKNVAHFVKFASNQDNNALQMADKRRYNDQFWKA